MMTIELLEYIRAARAQGMDDSAITNNLVQGGWDRASVEEGLKHEKPVMPKPLNPAAPVAGASPAQETGAPAEPTATVMPPAQVQPEGIKPLEPVQQAPAEPEDTRDFWEKPIFWVVFIFVLIASAAGAIGWVYFTSPSLFQILFGFGAPASAFDMTTATTTPVATSSPMTTPANPSEAAFSTTTTPVATSTVATTSSMTATTTAAGVSTSTTTANLK